LNKLLSNDEQFQKFGFREAALANRRPTFKYIVGTDTFDGSDRVVCSSVVSLFCIAIHPFHTHFLRIIHLVGVIAFFIKSRPVGTWKSKA
jgi:hypothetical protein